MAAHAQPRPTTLQGKLLGRLKTDPRKAAVLVVLMVVLAAMWLRITLKGGGPQRALASGSSSIAAGAGTDAAGAGGSAAGNRAAQLGPSAEQAAQQALGDWLGQPIPPIGRNLFSVKLDYFPREDSLAARDVPDDAGFWDDLAKSLSTQADQRKERQVLRENLQRQASQLRLQSTMMGATPRAVINAAMVGEGDVVAGFRVLKIEARRIIVEREGIQLEVPMN